MATKTKPQVTIEAGQRIQHVTGVLANEITAKDLQKYPEKYIRLYPSFYKNAKALEHEINTRAKKVQPIGSKRVILQKRASNGVTYSILTGK